MYTLTSILAALVRRERTGEGAAIQVSMLDALAEWMSAPMYAAVYGPGQAPRTGRRHHAIAPYGTFELSDGSTVLIAVQSDPEWRSLAEHLLDDVELGIDPRFSTNSARIANVDELEAILSSGLKSISADEAHRRLAVGRIANARVNDLRGVWDHEQLRARDHFHTVSTPSGEIEMLDAPFDISGWTLPQGPVPALDEHDADVLTAVIDRGRTQ
jgi:crotonobetainyl-CoA:carnitine CoA-transferase CaiB-like acyl-CoA transferase